MNPSRRKIWALAAVAVISCLLELFLTPSPVASVAFLFALSGGAIFTLVSRFGGRQVWSGTQALSLGTFFGLVSAWFLCFGIGMSIGGAVRPSDRHVFQLILCAISFGPFVLGCLIMSRYPAPNYQKGLFLTGMSLTPIAFLLLHIFMPNGW